jgi:hypothetical protein
MEVVEVVLKTTQIGVEGAATTEVVQQRGDRPRWRWSRLDIKDWIWAVIFLARIHLKFQSSNRRRSSVISEHKTLGESSMRWSKLMLLLYNEIEGEREIRFQLKEK